jgi:hypothetical protein
VIDFGEKIATFAVTEICNHPSLFGWLLVIFVVATLAVNAIKWTWPVYAEMPRPARFVLGLFMPLALNFYHLTAKLGVQEPLPPSSVANAPKDSAST